MFSVFMVPDTFTQTASVFSLLFIFYTCIVKNLKNNAIIIVSCSCGSDEHISRVKRGLTCVPSLRCDAKERSGCEFLRGVQVLQAGDHQEPHRASLHDRTPQGGRAHSHKPQTRGDMNRANQHFRGRTLRSECAVRVFTVGVVPGGHLSDDGWEQARSRCRGVAQRH